MHAEIAQETAVHKVSSTFSSFSHRAACKDACSTSSACRIMHKGGSSRCRKGLAGGVATKQGGAGERKLVAATRRKGKITRVPVAPS